MVVCEHARSAIFVSGYCTAGILDKNICLFIIHTWAVTGISIEIILDGVGGGGVKSREYCIYGNSNDLDSGYQILVWATECEIPAS